MIVKNFEFKKLKKEIFSFFLFYGDNQAFKDELINLLIKERNVSKTIYYEHEILKNTNLFFETISSKSFFDNDKFIIIKKTTDKIKDLIQEVIDKKFDQLTIILDSDNLEKRSKLRAFFEKDKQTFCVPFYPDNNQTLFKLASDFFMKKKIGISAQSINLIVDRSNGKRQHLNNELEKIESLMYYKKKIDIQDIEKITNLSSNHDISELVDTCLAKNKNKLNNIINENNFSNDDTILIIRTFLLKAKRLLKISDKMENNFNFESAITSIKPPVFWKDKEFIKKQIPFWSKEKTINLINEINKTEYLLKKNFTMSLNILIDFMFDKVNKS